MVDRTTCCAYRQRVAVVGTLEPTHDERATVVLQHQPAGWPAALGDATWRALARGNVL
jgi:hypothetical protein